MKTIKLLFLLLLAINVSVKSQSGGASGTNYVISGASSGSTYGGKVTAGGAITSPYPVGGDVTIAAGNGGSSSGNIILNAGTSTGSSQNGRITLNAPYNNGGGIYLNGITNMNNTLTVSGAVTGGSFTTTGAISAGSLTTSVMLNANGGFTTSKIIFVGGLTTSGAITTGSITASGTITAASLSVSGALYSTQDGYPVTYLKSWGLAGTGDVYIEPVAGGKLTLTDSWSKTGTLCVQFGNTFFESGNVAIGCTKAQTGYKLTVNGGIIAEEVKVITDVPASDYVFKKDYILMGLAELEKFINEHHHLPGIQSADEFKKNGYTVGQMDNLLLKQVEEIMLYLIEMKKENELLKKEVENLKK